MVALVTSSWRVWIFLRRKGGTILDPCSKLMVSSSFLGLRLRFFLGELSGSGGESGFEESERSGL